ncbi:NADH:flavin oxidoreductase/NADH oxidase [Roseovarius autotrophicus]|uniref:NADH:flavin oxidoreductase/NADH oxidase n=1 Tax=Roseovarius autotrophicus TaxID=2824121 RepID=UPI0019F48CC2|nr:NADH:flavin oxidoreductase/NADH oxidase [Roseovarius autotrophicus]MBE0453101.1 NADH:flavin oxidoreductase/NADH oxidase [Roseovarius sp.]
MSTPALFTPTRIGPLELENRIVIAPMCQYSAQDGCMTDWHLMHYGQLAMSGAGLLIFEASAVAPEGRISWADAGLYDDATEAAMARVMQGVRQWSAMPLGLQLAHAGRKGSCAQPWKGGQQLPSDDDRSWQTVAPSALPFAETDRPPLALDAAGLQAVVAAFAEAARRAARLGFDAVELHGAHGYLMHQFLSPLSNTRTDGYGGSLDNRMRLPLEVFEAVRAAFPADRPVTMRVSATDWVEGGWDVEQTAILARELARLGCAALHVSSGGLDPRQAIPVGPNYQVPLARALRAAVSMPVIAVGLITEPQQAEAIIGTGDADMIALARGILYNPRWPWHAAAELGAEITAPPQYWRSQPHTLKSLFRT